MTFAARASRNLSNTNNFSVPAAVATGSSGLNLYGVAVSRKNLWVTVGVRSTDTPPYSTPCATISTNGVNWLNVFDINTGTSYSPQWVAVNSSGLFVSVGYISGTSPVIGHFSTSTDGINWTTPTTFNGFTGGLYPTYIACSSSGQFLAVGYNLTTLRGYSTTSTDGVNWTTPALIAGYNATFFPTAIGVSPSGRWVIGGSIDNYPTNNNAFSTSTDGINWTTPAYFNGYTNPAGKSMSTKAIKINPNGKWVTLFWQGSQSGAANPTPFVSTSTDGVTWTTPTTIGTSNAYAVDMAVSPPTGRFVVAAIYGGNAPSYNNNYSMFMTSIDGTTWSTAAAMGGSTAFSFMEYIAINSEGLCVVVDAGPLTSVYSSNAVFP